MHISLVIELDFKIALLAYNQTHIDLHTTLMKCQCTFMNTQKWGEITK
jgi:hypothetical protein